MNPEMSELLANFWSTHLNWSLQTEVIAYMGHKLVKATMKDKSDRVIVTAHAAGGAGDSVEALEHHAIQRALALLPPP